MAPQPNTYGAQPKKKDPYEVPDLPTSATPANTSIQTGPTLQTQNAQQAPAAPLAQMQGRAAPTNFTNFARRFNANKQVAQREAGKYANQATTAAGKASSSLAASQAQFANGVNTGSVAPPPGSNAPVATNTGGAAPLPPPVNAISGTAASPALQPPAPTQTAAPGSIAEMLAKAGEQYSGPEGLDTTQAIPDAQAADQQLNALQTPSGVGTLVNESGTSGTSGADNLSGALIGAAGRKDFDALRAKFNPNKDVNDAQDKAIKTAEEAKKTSEANAAGWGKSASDAQTAEDARLAGESQAASDKASQHAKDMERIKPPPNKNGDLWYGVDKNAHGGPEMEKRKAEIDQFQRSLKTDTGDAVRDFVNSTSPSQGIAELTGNRNPLGDYFTETFHKDKGNDSFSTHGDKIPWGPEDFWVFRQMDPKQIAEINRLPHNAQKAWIARRNLELTNENLSRNSLDRS